MAQNHTEHLPIRARNACISHGAAFDLIQHALGHDDRCGSHCRYLILPNDWRFRNAGDDQSVVIDQGDPVGIGQFFGHLAKCFKKL